MKRLCGIIALTIYLFSASYAIHANNMGFLDAPKDTQEDTMHCQKTTDTEEQKNTSDQCFQKCVGDYQILSSTIRQISPEKTMTTFVYNTLLHTTQKIQDRHGHILPSNFDPPDKEVFSPYEDFIGITILLS